MSSDSPSVGKSSAAGLRAPVPRGSPNERQHSPETKNASPIGPPQTGQARAQGEPATSAEPIGRLEFQTKLEAALYWSRFGLAVIPIVAGLKKASVAWDSWLNNLSVEAIRAHWARLPSDDVGAILRHRQLVLDTDSPEASEALRVLEQRHGVEPRLIVSTSRGEHHYFALADGVFVKTDSHDGKLHPDRIDVKARRSQVNLPPSGVRKVKLCSVQHADQLSEVDQDFVDAVFRHNGREPPRPAPERELAPVEADDAHLAKIEALLGYIEADGGYADWTQVLMAIFHESQGSDAGLDLADKWSARGSGYPGRRALDQKWRSFSLDVANPVTIGTLIKRAKEAGADIDVLVGDAFTATSTPTEVIDTATEPEETAAVDQTPLDRFAFPPDALDRLRGALVDRVFVLAALALLGQSTFIFASPGTGKTLITLFLLLKALMSGTLGKVRVYYINLDDNVRGLFEKFPVSAEYGFKLISDNYYGFSASSLIRILDEMASDGTARNSIILLDTVKKVVNVMDKKEVSRFMSAVRRFVLKGGTFIGLAHTNKHPDGSGNPIPGGTSDIKDDADCAYLLREIDGGAETNEKFVEFECIKQRGNNAAKAAYAYSLDRDIPYADLLMSVRELGSDHVSATRLATNQASEALLIEAIRTCIAEGFDTKTKLLLKVGERTGFSRKRVGEIIDGHAGDDPLKHHWRFTVGARGSHVYQLLRPPGAEPLEQAAA